MQFWDASLPYIMATYKLHKRKYRWLTNAADCIFSGPATILTKALQLIIVELKQWCRQCCDTYKRFSNVSANSFWMIDSLYDFTLNLPNAIHSVYMADITCCYESIPLIGTDNLPDALKFIIKLAFQQYHSGRRQEHAIWVHIKPSTGKADSAKWSTTCPGTSCWIPLSQERLNTLQQWLITNYYICLGDSTWRQVTGIPMGFSYYPLWCNLYFVTYEIQFFIRLAKLGLYFHMSSFLHAYRYIDDLCVLNHPEVLKFLQPLSPRLPTCPFWIYPLPIVEIQTELDATREDLPDWGLAGHFLNVKIEITNFTLGIYQSTKFDKRRLLLFQFQQYIHFKLNRPVLQSYNIIISQIIPILYMCNSVLAAYEELQVLLDTLHTNGFFRLRLAKLVYRVYTTEAFPGICFQLIDLIHLLNPY